MPGEVVCTVALYDASGRALSNLNNAVAGVPLRLPEGPCRIRCRLRELPLSRGRYHLNVALSCGGGLIAHVAKAVEFDVEEGDFFGSGRNSPPGSAPLLLRHTWELDSEE